MITDMKTKDLNKGDYFRIKNNEDVFELERVINLQTVWGESYIVACFNISTCQLCHLFPNIEVTEVLNETEREEVNEFYNI